MKKFQIRSQFSSRGKGDAKEAPAFPLLAGCGPHVEVRVAPRRYRRGVIAAQVDFPRKKVMPLSEGQAALPDIFLKNNCCSEGFYFSSCVRSKPGVNFYGYRPSKQLLQI